MDGGLLGGTRNGCTPERHARAVDDSRVPRGGAARRACAEGFPPALAYIGSPRDADVRFAKKRTTEWIGYTRTLVHPTEVCEDYQPHSVTHVETTPAPAVDRDVVGRVHAELTAEDLLPHEHLVDAGYVDADQLLASARDYGVALAGPAPKDQQWQAEAGEGFAVGDFALDWDRHVATDPAGHQSTGWMVDHSRAGEVMHIRFPVTDCRPCLLRPRCTRTARRVLAPRRRDAYAALPASRDARVAHARRAVPRVSRGRATPNASGPYAPARAGGAANRCDRRDFCDAYNPGVVAATSRIGPRFRRTELTLRVVAPARSISRRLLE